MSGILKELPKAPKYVWDGVLYHLGGFLYTAKPRMIQFPVCDRCNARCIMCNRWQKRTDNEISLEKIREVFSSKLFSRVEDVCLHGGEPTLRKDLAGICEIILDACQRLKRLWISTNGFGPKRIKKRVLEVMEVLRSREVPSLDVNVSVDGMEETHDKIRGIPGGFQQTLETIDMLKALSKTFPINITMGTVIQPLNLNEIEDIEQLAGDLGIPVTFQPLMFDKFFNIPGDTDLKFSDDNIKEFKKIIKRKLANGYSTTNLYWRHFLSMMQGADRKIPCAFDRYVFSLYPTGEVLPCSREDWILFGNVYEKSADRIWFSKRAKMIRRKMKEEVCPECSFYCNVEFSLQKEFFTYLAFFLKNRLSKKEMEMPPKDIH